MFSTSFDFYLLSLLLARATAVILPTAPQAGDVFDTDKPCPIRWKPDNTDQWTNFTIDLMTGSNKAMVFVTNVATQLDGTIGSPVPYAWSCPDVDEHSPVWFYAFSNNVDGNSTGAIYSPRFTIASASGKYGPAPHPTQPDGQPTPWGYGNIIDHPEIVPKVATRGEAPKVPELFLPFARPIAPRRCMIRFCKHLHS